MYCVSQCPSVSVANITECATSPASYYLLFSYRDFSVEQCVLCNRRVAVRTPSDPIAAAAQVIYAARQPRRLRRSGQPQPGGRAADLVGGRAGVVCEIGCLYAVEDQAVARAHAVHVSGKENKSSDILPTIVCLIRADDSRPRHFG